MSKIRIGWPLRAAVWLDLSPERLARGLATLLREQGLKLSHRRHRERRRERLDGDLTESRGTMAGRDDVRVRRVYDEPAPDDGTRVLVDRIWPRGLTKAKASLDEWFKQIAPSTELRKWYSHKPERFEEFGRRYRSELNDPKRAEALAHLRELAKSRTLTLLTATKQPEISEAAVLAELLKG